MKYTLYCVVLAVVISMDMDLMAANVPGKAGKAVAQQQAATPPAVKPDENEKADETPAGQIDEQHNGDGESSENENLSEENESDAKGPQSDASVMAQDKARSAIENTFDSDADTHNQQKMAQSAMDDELSSMGLKGAELEVMQKQRRMIVDLVKKGKDFFMKNSLDVACNAYIKTKQFVLGEVYLFIYDTDGYCLAEGNDSNNLWADFTHDKVGTDEYGSVFVTDFIKKARAGGGWVSYRFRNESKVSYVEMIDVGSTQYVIGGGFYPHSKVYAVMNLVKGATRFFRDSQDKNIQEDSIFSTLSYPVGRFVSGDLYLFALDETGVLMVQGERPSLVGTNVLAAIDAKGKQINQEIVTRLNKKPEGIWIDYVSKGAPKKVYAERVTSKDGKNFYIACGYYPDATDKKLQEIVQEGYRHMKKGVEQALKDFNDHNDHIFHYGDLYLEVFTMKGVCVANGSDQEAIGRSYLEEKDEMGHYFMKKMIEVAQKTGKGWVNQKRRSSYEWTYLEKVNVGLEEYIISAGLYPISKVESMELLAKDAAEHLRSAKEVKVAFHDFIKKSGRFSLGDLEIFVYEPNGICIVNGSDTEYVWKNMINAKDELGRPYVKEMINAARRTPAHVKYRMNGADALAYVEKVDKDGRSFYVGSRLYTYENIEMSGINNADTKIMPEKSAVKAAQ